MHIADQDQKIKILLVVTNDENNSVQEKRQPYDNQPMLRFTPYFIDDAFLMTIFR